jgi:hypothetical protein
VKYYAKIVLLEGEQRDAAWVRELWLIQSRLMLRQNKSHIVPVFCTEPAKYSFADLVGLRSGRRA